MGEINAHRGSGREVQKSLKKLLVMMTFGMPLAQKKPYQSWIPNSWILLRPEQRQTTTDKSSRTNMIPQIYQMQVKSLILLRNSRASIQTQLWHKGQQNPEVKISILTFSKILQFLDLRGELVCQCTSEMVSWCVSELVSQLVSYYTFPQVC